MNKFYFFRRPAYVLVIGIITWAIASVMKILHWKGADMMNIAAMGILIIGLLILAIKLIFVKK
jgi:hypothetical protein